MFVYRNHNWLASVNPRRISAVAHTDIVTVFSNNVLDITLFLASGRLDGKWLHIAGADAE